MQNQTEASFSRNFNKARESVAHSQDAKSSQKKLGPLCDSQQNYDTARQDIKDYDDNLLVTDRNDFEIGGQSVRKSTRREGNKETIKKTDRQENLAVEQSCFDQEEHQREQLKRINGKSIHVRKLLKFHNGLLIPSTNAQQDYIRQGQIEAQNAAINAGQSLIETSMPLHNKPVREELAPIKVDRSNSTKRLNNSSTILLGGMEKTQSQSMTRGFNLQNRLAEKSNPRGAKQPNFQSILYQLSQPQNEDLAVQTKLFLHEDMFSSAKFREKPATDYGKMHVRFDGPTVLGRSICGDKNLFHGYQEKKLQMDAQAEKLKCAATKRRVTMRSTRAMRSKMNQNDLSPGRQTSFARESSIFGQMLREDRRISQTSFSQFLNSHVEDENRRKYDLMLERTSEHSEEKSMEMMPDKMGEMTAKQIRAADSYSLYQKGWSRMNRVVNNRTTLSNSMMSGYRRNNRSVYHSGRESSLLDKQHRYVSPRRDVLSPLYEQAQNSASKISNDMRRNLLIEKTHRQEKHKFDTEFARNTWVGNLRNDKCMYLQTTKNSSNALYCNIQTSSKDVLPYSTKNSIDFRYRLSALMTEEDEDENIQQKKLPNKINQTADLLTSDVNYIKQSPHTVASTKSTALMKPAVGRRTTKVFDGAVLERRRNDAEPAITYLSKRSDNNKHGVYLPQVAVAVKMHHHNREQLMSGHQDEQGSSLGYYG